MFALNTHTYFSFHWGTLSPEQLVRLAAERGYTHLALTDINNTSAVFEFYTRCREVGIHPVPGIEFRREGRFLFLGLARTAEGFCALNRFLSNASLQGQPLPDLAPELPDVWIVYERLVKPLEEFRPDEKLGVRPQHLNRLHRSAVRLQPDKLLALTGASFADPGDFRTHQILRAIDRNVVAGRLEAADCAHADDSLRTAARLQEQYAAFPFLLDNTRALLDSCEVAFESTHLHNRRTFTGSPADDRELLGKLARQGCQRRYPASRKEARDRLQKELRVIDQLDFPAYFLITWDIIRYARSAGYYHVGRGSGANSLVAYCLGITDVDPLELDLYFERFINPHRSSPPDFDIDFSWDERDDVTDYIFKRYGREHTALLATHNTFKGRSILRELGKVFGLPKDDIDRIVDHPTDAASHHPLAPKLFEYGKRIEKFPNYLSIHAGGIIISEKPLFYHTALTLMPKGFPITHFDMYGAEDLGYHKYDVLSQRGLGHIKEAVDLVRRNRGKSIDIHDVGTIKSDEKVRTQLRSGQCIGCFYIESPAMRGLLSKLRCDNYVHLVAASSIIRPGVAKSGMMREYIQRFHDPKSFRYLHPVFEEHLGETFGVMVYQEDVMKIVHHFAGLDLDESDVLRRIMTGKKKSSAQFERLRQKFFDNCRERKYPETLSTEVWRQVESFSGYSFCKAHSASYAVESFQSLYLKAYYPIEFMVAVINNFGGFYSTELYAHEARMCGARVYAPCVNHSEYLTSVHGDDVYLGFVHVHALEKQLALQVVEERQSHGEYRSLEDFTSRISIGVEQLDILIRVGAFRFTGRSKYELLWEKNAVAEHGSRTCAAVPIFADTVAQFHLPQLSDGADDQAFDEIELLGFPLGSPFDLLAEDPGPSIRVEDMPAFLGKRATLVGYFVTLKHVTTVHHQHMNFATWIDAGGRFFDTTHFPPVLARHPFRGKGVYRIRGKVVSDFGFLSLDAESLEKLPYRKDERY